MWRRGRAVGVAFGTAIGARAAGTAGAIFCSRIAKKKKATAAHKLASASAFIVSRLRIVADAKAGPPEYRTNTIGAE